MEKSLKRTLATCGIGLGVMVLGMIWAIVNTALASIQKDLSADILQLQWVMNCFGIFLCVPLLTMGKLGDSYGRKKLYLIGLFGTLLASFIAGFAGHIGVVIACMGLYGLSGSLILPLSQALLVHQFPESQKEKAVALWGIFVSISVAIGPLIGGAIVNLLGWRWIYWINAPLILAAIFFVMVFVEKEKTGKKPHCDWAGVALLAIIVGSLIISIMQGPNWGWTSPLTLCFFALAIISTIIFTFFELKTSAPLFRPDLFSHRGFLFSSIPNGCLLGYIWVAFFMIPLYLQNMRGLSPLMTGLTMLTATLPVAFLSVPVSKCYKKIGAKPLILSGFSLLIVASLTQIYFVSEVSFFPILLASFLLGMGWVMAWGPSISCALSSLPHHLAGMASGMFTTLQELGAIVSLAIAGVIFRLSQTHSLSPYQSQLNSALSNYTPDQIESLSSNPTAVAETLGPASDIVSLLRSSFMESYHQTFWYLLTITIGAMVLASFLRERCITPLK